MKKDMVEWLSSGLLAGREVTVCQRRTKVYRLVARELSNARTEMCPPPALEVCRGSDASGDVYAVVLTGRSSVSSAPAMTAALMAACHYYALLLFRYDLDSRRWTAVLTREDLAETAENAKEAE